MAKGREILYFFLDWACKDVALVIPGSYLGTVRGRFWRVAAILPSPARAEMRG